MTIGGEAVGTIEIGLFGKTVPKTVAINFAKAKKLQYCCKICQKLQMLQIVNF